jgi:YhcH/YjgK/YiaL family protein
MGVTPRIRELQMILAKLDDLSKQMALSEALQKALAFLADEHNHTLVDGRYEIDGNQVYALVQRYDTLTGGMQFEAHQKYIDIQFVVSGCERMDWLPVDQMQITEPYDAARDVCKGFAPNGLAVPALVRAGQAAVFFPADAHAPKLAVDVPVAVHKIVIKLAVA